MYRLSLSSNALSITGGVWPSPTMLYVATLAEGDEQTIYVVRHLFAGELIEHLKTILRAGAESSIFSLMIATPPYLNGTSRWNVEVVEDFGRPAFDDFEFCMTSTSAYRTSSGAMYIDNGFRSPSLSYEWTSYYAIPGIAEGVDQKTMDARETLAATLTRLLNNAILDPQGERPQQS
ncbi:hypothetical protein [Pseudomonas syringae]|nr:hypothetical protein [Pseudomonas syringae]